MAHTLAHFSDLHLGYEAYAARSQRGHNQRGEDVVRAVHRVVDDIVATDPPLVVCSGDVAELPHVPVRYMLAAAHEFTRLAARRPDGSRRQLVVIAGNHDQSKHVRDGCFLELYRGLPGVHVVTSGYQQVRFDGDADAPRELDGTVVHAVPHDALRDLAELGVAPVEGMVNVLTTHGVAESSDLYRRAVGREYLIPAELLLMEWDYVALGHWHTQGPVFPLGVKGTSSPVWYAGSVESVDFGDVRGARCDERGWLSVQLRPGEHPEVTRRRHPVRPMVNLPEIVATGLTPEQVAEQLVANLADESLAGSVCRQRVSDVSRDLWALVDTTTAHAAARDLLHYRLDPRFVREVDGGTDDDQPRGLARVGSLLSAQVDAEVPEADRAAVLDLARSLLREVAVEAPAPDDDGDAATTGVDADGATSDQAAVDPDATGTDGVEPAVAEAGDTENVPGPAAAPAGEESGTDPDGTDPDGIPVRVPPPLDEADRARAVAGLLAEFDGIDLGKGAS